jgi:hypothetical protein
MSLPKLIGIHGKARSGKDTCADHLVTRYANFHQEAFADTLKQACSIIFGVPLHKFHDDVLKEKDAFPWEVSPRKMAQFVGTEVVREGFSRFLDVHEATQFWITRMEMKLRGTTGERKYTPENTIILTDVRFQNEYDWIIENNGTIIHLTRPGADGIVGIANHASEQSINLWNKEKTHAITNDSTLNSLFSKLDDVIAKINSQQTFSA